MPLFGPRARQKELRTLGTVEVPSDLDSAMWFESNDAAGHAFYEVINSFFWMGSNTPVRRALSVIVAAPDRDVAAAGKLSGELPFQHCTAVRLAPAGPGIHVGECTYEVNTHVEPCWIGTLADPARRLAIAYRVFKKKERRENVAAVMQAAASSFRPSANPRAYFEQVRDQPRRDALATVENENRVIAWILQQGWPRPELERTLQHGNFAYRLTEYGTRRLEIAALLGWLPSADYKRPEIAYELHRTVPFDVVEFDSLFRGEWRVSKPGQVLEVNDPLWSVVTKPLRDPGRVYLFLFHLGVFGPEGDHAGLLDRFRNAAISASRHLNPL